MDSRPRFTRLWGNNGWGREAGCDLRGSHKGCPYG